MQLRSTPSARERVCSDRRRVTAIWTRRSGLRTHSSTRKSWARSRAAGPTCAAGALKSLNAAASNESSSGGPVHSSTGWNADCVARVGAPERPVSE
jgi:hypothetical protein